MASLIPGYEYDIFISYRQKDNKGDRWVSRFVEDLKTELESNFKEEVSVYFDVNPHDGLLDTHDVDASLKEKLNCLVFIPIISRSFCEPKSFAWKHEFLAFIEKASQDQYGLKVKLPNGNVASRVLPVVIHNLDEEDLALCESALGGVLRGVEFIYKEPGINKPLAPDDDGKVNLNKTKYRNQVNKAGNAIREVIYALKKFDKTNFDRPAGPSLKSQVGKKIKKKYFIAGGLCLLLFSAFFFLPKLTGLYKPKNKIIRNESIVDIELINNTKDSTRIISTDIIEYLVIYNISNKCNLTLLDKKQFNKIHPHEKKTINLPRKYIKLKIVNDELLNQDEIEWKLTDNQNHSAIENKVNFRDHTEFLNFTGNLSQVISDLAPSKPDKNYLTSDWKSFMNYYQGEKAWSEINKIDAKKYFSNSIEADTSFILPYLRLAKVYYHERDNSSAKEAIDIVVRSIEKLTIPDSIMARALWHTLNMENEEAIENYLHLVALLPAMKESYFELAEAYFRICDIENASINYRNALTIDPDYTLAHNHLAYCFCASGNHDSALVHVKKYLALDPSANSWDSYGDILFAMGDLGSAVWAKNNGLQLDPRRDYLYESLAYINVQQGNIKGALENLDKYISLQNDPVFINKGLTDKAFIYYLKKDYRRSLDTCLKAKSVFDTLDLLTRNHVLHWIMSRIYFETGDKRSLNSEMNDMEDIIKKNNVNKFNNYNMVLKFYLDIRIHQLFRENKPDEAKELVRVFDDDIYNKVKDWNYPFDIAFFNSEFGKLYLEAGDLDLARERFEKALSYNSKYIFAHLGLAVYFGKTGNEDDERLHFSQFSNAVEKADPELQLLLMNEYIKLKTR